VKVNYESSRRLKEGDCLIIQIFLKKSVFLSFNRNIPNIKEKKRHLLNVKTLSGTASKDLNTQAVFTLYVLQEMWSRKQGREQLLYEVWSSLADHFFWKSGL